MMRSLQKWLKGDDAAIAVEVGLLMPVMLLMIMIVVDVGNGILTNEKVLTATQTVADLLAREDSVSTVILDDAVEAGKLAMMPYATGTFGVDVAGIQFNGGPTKPVQIWRDTVNMTANPNIVANATGLGDDKDGVLGVTVQYTFKPVFSGVFTGPLVMQEVSYARGRSGAFIPRV